ncbi:hypothetical protein DPMN_115718 [Dreissena polymorpha]|uniref:Uncharacterized protein n=1 Tax=Dreissena polymorpha TaxID=45954 RepID=A0A9D4QTL8_DREPO|nr:hypothetical protein DPMN_115718 [Dreissena polymorpha]
MDQPTEGRLCIQLPEYNFIYLYRHRHTRIGKLRVVVVYQESQLSLTHCPNTVLSGCTRVGKRRNRHHDLRYSYILKKASPVKYVG